MKAQLRKIARVMAGWPVIGRFVRISMAVIRLPDLNRRQHTFENEQLPTLLATLSDLNHRQLLSDKSIPVSLRKITRDLSAIRGQLESLSNSADQRISATQRQLETLSNSADQRISATQGQLEGVSSSVGYLLGRVEFVRRDLMFEMRYGASPREGEQVKSRTEIIFPEKLAAARNDRLRLNLGCGHMPLKGFLNVDRRKLPGIDIIAEVDDLPFEKGEVDEIFSAHLLEHFPQEQLRRTLLPYFHELLKPGGIFQAVVPDGLEMAKRVTANPDYFEDFRLVTFGGQDYEGDFHFNSFSPESLSRLLTESGFATVEIVDRARQNDICYEFEIRAIK